MKQNHRRCIRGLAVAALFLTTAVAHAQQPTSALDIPGNGTTVSGIGVISGWKCEVNGDLTISFDDGDPIPLLYGSQRPDVLEEGNCPDADVGFVAIWNWGRLSDGEHTAVVYDNGVEFDRSTFTVVTTGVEFLMGASGMCEIPDFPSPGETARFVWNQGTQHLELTEVSGEPDVSGDVSRFDGTWRLSITLPNCSVQIGALNIEIASGALSYSGMLNINGTDIDLQATGTVSSSGAVAVSVEAPAFPTLGSVMTAQGTLSDGSGSGTLELGFLTTNCSGTWTATKR